jgi:hypothetical protein
MEAGGGLFSADAVFDDIDYFSDVDDSTSFDAEDTKPLAISLQGLTTICETLKPVLMRPLVESVV